MTRSSHRIRQLAQAFAHTIPTVDEAANHSRWKPGIGPFEEEIDAVTEALFTSTT